jgi:DNA-binding MarR family transcriptional regulator
MKAIELPEDYALVLQQVDQNGEEDFTNLAESLKFDRQRLAHIIQALRSKGLIYIHSTTQDIWISLSSKGHRLVETVWPESGLYLTMG